MKLQEPQTTPENLQEPLKKKSSNILQKLTLTSYDLQETVRSFKYLQESLISEYIRIDKVLINKSTFLHSLYPPNHTTWGLGTHHNIKKSRHV